MMPWATRMTRRTSVRWTRAIRRALWGAGTLTLRRSTAITWPTRKPCPSKSTLQTIIFTRQLQTNVFQVFSFRFHFPLLFVRVRKSGKVQWSKFNTFKVFKLSPGCRLKNLTHKFRLEFTKKKHDACKNPDIWYMYLYLQTTIYQTLCKDIQH